MLTVEQMKLQASNYMLDISEDTKNVYLLKTKGDVKISHKRALDWANAGISDLDCRSKQEMIDLFTSWIEEAKK
jgi:hypothetical protein